mgnify:CR=1 FL=1
MATNEKTHKVQKSSTNGLVKFLRELKAEVKRITWPSRNEIKKSTIIVFVFCAIAAALIGIFDYGFSGLYKIIFK